MRLRKDISYSNYNLIKARSFLFWQKVNNWIIHLLQFIIFKKARRPKRILIFRTGSLGDSICAIPALMNIRKNFPDAHISILTNAGAGNLVSMDKLISPGLYDDIINYLSLSRVELTSLLKQKKFGLIIQLPQDAAPLIRQVRDMIYFRFLAGIPSGFGWHFNVIMKQRQFQEKYLQQENERSRLNRILARNGLKIFYEDQFALNNSTADQEKVDQVVAALVPQNGKANLAVVAGAKRPQNRWPIAYFKQVVQHFSEDFNVLLAGGPEDADLVRPLLDIPNVYSFCGKLTPIQSAILLKKCVLALSNDTGPMHLSYAVGTPVVALFSSRDFPDKWFPPEKGNVVFRTPEVHCSLCLSETCPNNICMQQIKPVKVIEAMESLLLKTAPSDS